MARARAGVPDSDGPAGVSNPEGGSFVAAEAKDAQGDLWAAAILKRSFRDTARIDSLQAIGGHWLDGMEGL